MEILAGKVRHYYSAIGVASISVTDSLSTGDMIHVKGHITDFDQMVESMEVNRQPVQKASKGQLVGIKIKDYVRTNDLVYRIE